MSRQRCPQRCPQARLTTHRNRTAWSPRAQATQVHHQQAHPTHSANQTPRRRRGVAQNGEINHHRKKQPQTSRTRCARAATGTDLASDHSRECRWRVRKSEPAQSGHDRGAQSASRRLRFTEPVSAHRRAHQLGHHRLADRLCPAHPLDLREILRGFIRWLQRVAHAPRTLSDAIPKVYQPAPRLTIATDDDRDRILAHAPPPLKFFLPSLCADLGLRHRAAPVTRYSPVLAS